jgi:hypothetical protein
VEEPASTLDLQQLAGGGERFAIADAIGRSDAFQMGQRRDKIFANPFDQPGAGFAVAPGFDLVGKDRARRIGEDKFRFWRVSANQACSPPSVPPEPTPTTMASISPSSCSYISGAVVACASGLASLLNWSI